MSKKRQFIQRLYLATDTRTPWPEFHRQADADPEVTARFLSWRKARREARAPEPADDFADVELPD